MPLLVVPIHKQILQLFFSLRYYVKLKVKRLFFDFKTEHGFKSFSIKYFVL